MYSTTHHTINGVGIRNLPAFKKYVRAAAAVSNETQSLSVCVIVRRSEKMIVKQHVSRDY